MSSAAAALDKSQFSWKENCKRLHSIFLSTCQSIDMF